MVARTGASTEKQPFTAHAQGMKRGATEPSVEMPRGKGRPMRIPAGITRIMERMTFAPSG